MSPTTLGIIGYGFVGKAVEHGFRDENHEILIHDKFKPSQGLEKVAAESDFLFVCVPTPYKNDAIDLTIMDEVLKHLTQYTDGTKKIVIIKSTVIPGTTEHYIKKYPSSNFCFNPEFLTEKNHLDDFIHADRIVIGAEHEMILDRVENLYTRKFPDTPLFRAKTKEAEMCKYMANCLLMTKVIFANEIYDLCESFEIDYNAVKDMVAADKRIGSSHLTVTKERGFGGKCFPKDLIAILASFRERGVDASVLETIFEKNLRIRRKRDWEEIPFVKG